MHIIKSHGALPPGAPLDNFMARNDSRDDHESMRERRGDESMEVDEDDDIAEKSQPDDNEDPKKIADEDKRLSVPANEPSSPLHNFGLDLQNKNASSPLKNAATGGGGLNDLLQRQMMSGLMNPLLMPGLAAGNGQAAAGAAANAGAAGQLQGLFNMFLSEMLKKVQKDTPPQTPPISPQPLPSADTPPVSSSGGSEENVETNPASAVVSPPATLAEEPSSQMNA